MRSIASSAALLQSIFGIFQLARFAFLKRRFSEMPLRATKEGPCCAEKVRRNV